MEKSKVVRVLLMVSGIIGIGIGGALLFVPVAFEASAGINLGEDLNLLSEIRAPGGALLSGGIIIFLGAFIPKLTHMSLVLSSLFYLSYGFSRVLSMMIDGIPHNSLLSATIIEIIIGLLSLFLLCKFGKPQHDAS